MKRRDVKAREEAEARLGRRVREDVRRLERELAELHGEYETAAGRLVRGRGEEEPVIEIEAEIDEVERNLKRARATLASF